MLVKRLKSLMVLLVPLVLSLPVVSCGDSATEMSAAAKTLQSYYRSNPPARGWKVKSVSVKDGSKIVIDIYIQSASDLNQIQSVSRMQQFSIAKKACPSPSYLASLPGSASVWVQLRSKTKTLTQSICPH